VRVTGSRTKEEEIAAAWRNATVHNLDPEPAPVANGKRRAQEDDLTVTGSQSRADAIAELWRNAAVTNLDDDEPAAAGAPPERAPVKRAQSVSKSFVGKLLAGGSEYGQMIDSLHNAPLTEVLKIRRALAKPSRETKNGGNAAAKHRVQEALRIVRARVREAARPGQSE